MLIHNIGNTCAQLYDNMLHFNNSFHGGDDESSTPGTEIMNVYKNFIDSNKDKLVDFKNNVTSKYFKDQIITCLRKHASDTDNIDSLKKNICSNNIYSVINKLYKLPDNINNIKDLLLYISVALFLIFSINFVMIIFHIMNNHDVTSLIIFLILLFVLVLLAFLSVKI